MNIIPFEEDAIKQTRFDIVILSKQLSCIEKNIDDFHQCAYAFEQEYQQRLGDLAESVLLLRAQLGMTDNNNGAATTVTTYLAEAEYQQLKAAYRKAAKLCHPDYLSEQHRDIGLQLFDTLNKAYHLQDLTTVEHILWLLQSGQAFEENLVIITDDELLLKRKALLSHLIEQKKDQLNQLKMQEEYDVSNPDNWNILLYDYQTRLEDELAVLRSRVKHNTKHV